MEINTAKNLSGYIFTIKSVEKNKLFKCENCYYLNEICEKKRELSTNPTKTILTAVEVVINIKNTAHGNWTLDDRDCSLIDTDGFIYSGKILCKEITPNRFAKDRDIVVNGSQANYIQIFPELPKNIEVSSLVIRNSQSSIRFNINDLSDDSIFALPENDINKQSNNNETHFQPLQTDYSIQYQVDDFTRKINYLKVLIYSRFQNILLQSEANKLDNKINTEIFTLELELKSVAQFNLDRIEPMFVEAVSDYKSKIIEFKENEKKRNVSAKKIEELYELSPREFEEYIASVLVELGHSNVIVTPYSNDKGIDILLEKNDVKIAVQCKRYKGTVGSPDIQKFIGSMQHAKVDKGLFITTGMFSFEAEKMAVQHPIELINRIELINLVNQAFNK